ncbi:FxsA cytoplasmic membrane protein [[Clostridium] ultunense Esp]|uniref:FxsA cytoplasmic membrane protein n=1 Tax=[Clostridium] ultunense Esp TaxID=1288971 RepID=M1Z516_9FIRM|nr:FxsA family protein [Schnuerera ultunensis]CCQ97975.1 FxsA cytoplasmic membrane protein [[Clostridium] ultunense Esp]SHD75640.1 FxsA cytoplasmic membrane protein [[Clostridium] ultunense Esp]
MKKIILLFILLPILDLYILIKASQTMGFGVTVVLIILTGIAGYYLAKTEGRLVIRNINNAMSQGNIPGNEILTGFSILIGGFLLLLPGIVTDIIGITMVLPGTRNFYKEYIRRKIERMINKGYTRIMIRW